MSRSISKYAWIRWFRIETIFDERNGGNHGRVSGVTFEAA
jgi:hypothetical protein